MNLRGKFTTDADGRFAFRSVMMVGYPIPTDGVVGRLLKAQNRHPYRPAHLHALIFKPGFKVLISQVYDPADPHIDSDVQFGVTKALIGDFVRHDEPHPTEARCRRALVFARLRLQDGSRARPCCRGRRSSRPRRRRYPDGRRYPSPRTSEHHGRADHRSWPRVGAAEDRGGIGADRVEAGTGLSALDVKHPAIGFDAQAGTAGKVGRPDRHRKVRAGPDLPHAQGLRLALAGRH